MLEQPLIQVVQLTSWKLDNLDTPPCIIYFSPRREVENTAGTEQVFVISILHRFRCLYCTRTSNSAVAIIAPFFLYFLFSSGKFESEEGGRKEAVDVANSVVYFSVRILGIRLIIYYLRIVALALWTPYCSHIVKLLLSHFIARQRNKLLDCSVE